MTSVQFHGWVLKGNPLTFSRLGNRVFLHGGRVLAGTPPFFGFPDIPSAFAARSRDSPFNSGKFPALLSRPGPPAPCRFFASFSSMAFIVIGHEYSNICDSPPAHIILVMRKPPGRKVAFASGLALLVLIPAVWAYWPHILFRINFESMGRNEQGYAEYRHRQTGIIFVSVPGGTFVMGSPEEEVGREENEGPVHEVSLSPFMIGKYEVTQEQWEAVMGNNPSQFKGADLPVDTVSWDDIQGFEAATGLGLPSEAQWEYACRAGTTGPYAGTGNLDDMGWSRDNSGGNSHAVGQKQPNQFGLHDMHGNVWEWCEDVLDNTFYSRKDVPGFDPLSTAGSESRVFRGGGWYFTAPLSRSAYRNKGDPVRLRTLGFRPAVPTP